MVRWTLAAAVVVAMLVGCAHHTTAKGNIDDPSVDCSNENMVLLDFGDAFLQTEEYESYDDGDDLDDDSWLDKMVSNEEGGVGDSIREGGDSMESPLMDFDEEMARPTPPTMDLSETSARSRSNSEFNSFDLYSRGPEDNPLGLSNAELPQTQVYNDNSVPFKCTPAGALLQVEEESGDEGEGGSEPKQDNNFAVKFCWKKEKAPTKPTEVLPAPVVQQVEPDDPVTVVKHKAAVKEIKKVEEEQEKEDEVKEEKKEVEEKAKEVEEKAGEPEMTPEEKVAEKKVEEKLAPAVAKETVPLPLPNPRKEELVKEHVLPPPVEEEKIQQEEKQIEEEKKEVQEKEEKVEEKEEEVKKIQEEVNNPPPPPAPKPAPKPPVVYVPVPEPAAAPSAQPQPTVLCHKPPPPVNHNCPHKEVEVCHHHVRRVCHKVHHTCSKKCEDAAPKECHPTCRPHCRERTVKTCHKKIPKVCMEKPLPVHPKCQQEPQQCGMPAAPTPGSNMPPASPEMPGAPTEGAMPPAGAPSAPGGAPPKTPDEALKQEDSAEQQRLEDAKNKEAEAQRLVNEGQQKAAEAKAEEVKEEQKRIETQKEMADLTVKAALEQEKKAEEMTGSLASAGVSVPGMGPAHSPEELQKEIDEIDEKAREEEDKLASLNGAPASAAGAPVAAGAPNAPAPSTPDPNAVLEMENRLKDFFQKKVSSLQDQVHQNLQTEVQKLEGSLANKVGDLKKKVAEVSAVSSTAPAAPTSGPAPSTSPAAPATPPPPTEDPEAEAKKAGDEVAKELSKELAADAAPKPAAPAPATPTPPPPKNSDESPPAKAAPHVVGNAVLDDASDAVATAAGVEAGADVSEEDKIGSKVDTAAVAEKLGRDIGSELAKNSADKGALGSLGEEEGAKTAANLSDAEKDTLAYGDSTQIEEETKKIAARVEAKIEEEGTEKLVKDIEKKGGVGGGAHSADSVAAQLTRLGMPEAEVEALKGKAKGKNLLFKKAKFTKTITGHDPSGKLKFMCVMNAGQ